MTPRPASRAGARPTLESLPISARWVVLVAVSILFAGALNWMRLPAAFMLGPLGAGVLAQAAGGAVKVPRVLFVAAQAIIGCLIARAFTRASVASFGSHGLIFLAVVAITIAASLAIGWAMTRLRVFPGGTAIWGMLPGAASAMVVMAEAYDEDFRLVAFMQYIRVVLVAVAASTVGLLYAHGGVARFAGGYFPPVNGLDFAETVAVAAAGAGLAATLRIPAGALLGPMVVGGALNVLGWMTIELPPAVLILSYALIGWNTGLRFTRAVVAAAARALPQCIGATLILMIFCGLVAWLLSVLLSVDPLTAYLATSPGGVDAAAIIAASTKVDAPFVMGLQTVRAILLILIGPQIARWAAGKLAAPRPTAKARDEPSLGDLD